MIGDKSIFFLMGTTASGKTSLGLDFIKRFRNTFEVVCVDSVTFYKGFNIGSAKPSKEELSLTRHHLVDFLDQWESYSIGNFIIDAKKCINDIILRRKIPLLIGGSSLYFYSLLYGITPLPKTNQAIREELISISNENNGLEKLFIELNRLDPCSANNINKNDKNRIIRALEVCLITGGQYSTFVKQPRVGGIINLIKSNEFKLKQIIIYPDNISDLKDSITLRLNNMLKDGFLEETRYLYEFSKIKGVKFPALNSVGYKQLLPYFSSNLSLEICIENIKKATLELAKKQRLWLKKWLPKPDIYLQPGKFNNRDIDPF